MSVNGPRGCDGGSHVTRTTLGEYASAATLSGADGATHAQLLHHHRHRHHHRLYTASEVTTFWAG